MVIRDHRKWEATDITYKTQMPAKSLHHNDVIMSMMVYQITSLTIIYSTVYSGTD